MIRGSLLADRVGVSRGMSSRGPLPRDRCEQGDDQGLITYR
jgi:hypothetical protein